MSEVKLLIDGDSILYRAAFVTEKTKYLVEDTHVNQFAKFDDAKTAKATMSNEGVLWSRKELEPVENAELILDLTIRDIKAHFPNVDGCSIYLSPSVGNFRERIATRAKYKGNRDSSPRPTHLKALFSRATEKHGAIVTEGQEAEDAVGIELTEYPDSIIVHIDKDLNQLPGRHFNFVTNNEYVVTKKEAVINFYSQVISGDATDNIPGVAGLGPAKAGKLLAGATSPGECWNRVLEAYWANNLKQADAIETAQLVYLRRKPGQIWTPPT